MSILITGANGQLGSELCQLFDEKKVAYTATNQEKMDITDKESVDRVFQQVRPTVVFHCAAYTAVDQAEDEGKAINEAVNVLGTKYIAEASEKIGASLFYISTDYVFDGTSTAVYPVDAETNPQNEYGRAKLAGEELVQSICSNYYIVRTSWVFGKFGHNFVYTMRRLAEAHPVLTVVADQVGRPTWTRTLAEFLVHLMETKPAFGLYQLSNDDTCSWFEFAKEILKNEDIEIKPVTSEEYPQKAHRPRHSVMDLSKAKETGFVIPGWKEALAQFLQTLN